MTITKYIGVWVCVLGLIVGTGYAVAEVIVLKDGGKYVGKVEDLGDKWKIITKDGEIQVAKDRIKAIYKDAEAILKETSDTVNAARTQIDNSKKIENPKERNVLLDSVIATLEKTRGICEDVLDAYARKDAEAIANRINEINVTVKYAKSLKVLDKDLTPPPPPPPKDTPPDDRPTPKPKDVDKKKLEAAKEFYSVGVTKLNDKKYDEAKDFFIKALSYYEDYAEAYARLGDTYEALKEEELAYENYQRCIEIINSTESPAPEITALRDEVTKKTDKFNALEEKLTGLNKEFITQLMKLGNQCMDESDFSLAEEIFALVIQMDESNDEAAKNLQKAREEIEKESKKSEKENEK